MTALVGLMRPAGIALETELAVRQALLVGPGALLVQAGDRPVLLGCGLGHPGSLLGRLGQLGAALGHLSVLAGHLLATPIELALVAPMRETLTSQRERGQHENNDNNCDHYSDDRCG